MNQTTIPSTRKAVLLIIFLLTLLGAFGHAPALAQSEGRVLHVRPDGNDQCNGAANAADTLPDSDMCAFRTADRALAAAQPGDTVSLQPGIYREPIVPTVSGSAEQPIVIEAAAGPDTVFFLASVSSADFAWQSYADYAATGGGFALQPGVDANQIRAVPLNWCLTEDVEQLQRTFYASCADVPGDQVAVPFETDLIAVVGASPLDAVRLPKAKEPDWQVDAAWRYSENWWKADQGAASLNDAQDDPRRTSNQFLRDTQDDHLLDEDLNGRPDFPNIPPGNVRDVFAAGDFADPREALAPAPGVISSRYAGQAQKSSLGATIIFNDARDGHYTNNMFIDGYNDNTGVLSVQDIYNVEDFEKLGYLTKFYIEGSPRAMDCPGEWVHHDGWLFILTGSGCGRTVTDADLQRLEIAQQFEMLRLNSVSHIVVKDLNFAFGNNLRVGHDLYRPAWNGGPPVHVVEPAKIVSVTGSPDRNSGATRGVVLDGIAITDSVTGLAVVDSRETVDATFSLVNSRFERIDDRALRMTEGHFSRLVIENNVFRDIGFRPISEDGDGVFLGKVSNLIFRHNLVQNIGHNGVQILQENVIRDELSRFILVEGNTFDSACQMATDCGGLKFHGFGRSFGYGLLRDLNAPDINSVLVVNNVASNNLGWTYARWRKDLGRSHPNVGAETSWRYARLGFMANGYYLDFASGVTFYDNVSVNSGRAGIFLNFIYRDGRNYIINNIVHNALDAIYFQPTGFYARSADPAEHNFAHVDTRIQGNILSGFENSAILLSCSQGDELGQDGSLRTQGITIEGNVFHKYANNPVPNPYEWWDPAYYEPADIHYMLCDDTTEVNYVTVNDIQALTPWQNAGLDWPSDAPLFANPDGRTAADFVLVDAALAADFAGGTVPATVGPTIGLLESTLGVTVGGAEPPDTDPVIEPTPDSGNVTEPPAPELPTVTPETGDPDVTPVPLPGPVDGGDDGTSDSGDQAPQAGPRPLRRLAILVVLMLALGALVLRGLRTVGRRE